MNCNKLFRSLLLGAGLLLGLGACSETAEVEIIPPTSEGRTTLELSSESPLLKMQEEALTGEIGFKSRGGEVAIDVLTNQPSWRYEAQGAEWLTLRADDYFLYIASSRNESDMQREATVIISAGEGDRRLSARLTITQNHAGVPEISLATNSLRLKAHTDLQQEVTVETNQEEWSFACTCPWMLVEQLDGALRLSIDDNQHTAQREAELIVTAGEGEKSDSDRLIIRQDGDAFVILSSHNVATDDQGGEKRVQVESNPELEWQVVTDEQEWFTATPDGEELRIVIEPNMGGNQRYGRLTVIVGDQENSASVDLTIHQIGPDTEALIYEVEIPEAEYLLTAAPVLTSSTGGTITVDWGDGSPAESFESRRGTHTYRTPGLYTISITGEAKSLQFGQENSFSTELRSVISWGKLGYTSAVDMCLGCSRLESIPNDVAGSFSGVKSFLGAFSCCESLKEIPAGLFRYATAAKNFEDCFSHSGAISAIPEGLFDQCTAAETFTYAFYATGTGIVETNSTLSNFEEVQALVEQGRLRSIPEGLFSNCRSAIKFNYLFGATALEEIPAGLFAQNAAATTFTGAFSGCVNLTSLPQELMMGATAATDIKYMFAGCSSLREIPVGMFVNNAAVTNLEYIFYKTGVSTLRSGLFEGLTQVKTLGAVFQDCPSLTTLEEGLFDGLSAARSFRYCFADCQALRSIPAGLLRNMTNAYEFTYMFHNTGLEEVPATLFSEVRDYSSADFTYLFSECMNLKTVPAGLFDRFTKVTSPGYRNLFDNSGIETIPAGLFAQSTAVSSGFESLFENCPHLKRIEGSIFPETTSVSSVAYLFCNCPSLEEIPEDLFLPFGEAKLKFTATFAGCSSLQEIPAALFAANSKTKQFSETFADCTSLTAIPEGLLAACSEITTVKGIFTGCTSLQSIPADLFANCPAITSFEGAFAECRSLRTIPERLFAAIGTKSSSITFAECFMGCAALESIPAGLFDTVRRINYINKCFKGCSSLSGESPYTLLVGEDGTEQRVHLYERERGDDFPIIPSSSSAHADCFQGCNNLTDYATMPTAWR